MCPPVCTSPVTPARPALAAVSTAPSPHPLRRPPAHPPVAAAAMHPPCASSCPSPPLPRVQSADSSESTEATGPSEGLTSAERNRLLARLHTRRRPPCPKCTAYRSRIAELQREFEALRSLLMPKACVEPVDAIAKTSVKLRGLAEEGAKLRITIDTLVRSQVRSFKSAL